MRSYTMLGGKRINVTESSSHKSPGQIGWLLAERLDTGETAKADVDSDDADSIASRYRRLSSLIYTRMGIKVTADHIESVMTEKAATLGAD